MKHTRDEVIEAFRQAVNMAPNELEAWLATEESNSAGLTKPGENESIGHQSGRRIVQLLEKQDEDVDEQDLEHMTKVTSYVKRHMAQRPHKDDEQLSHSRWCWSLKNWGHDPLKSAPAV